MIFNTTVFGGLPCKIEVAWVPESLSVGYGYWEFQRATTIKGDWIECKLTESDHERFQVEAEAAFEYQQIDGDL